jgi:hypothetical protein
MALDTMQSLAATIFGQLSLAEGWAVLEPLIVFVTGMVIYSVFVFKFYKFISRRNIFSRERGEASGLKKVFYALEYIFLFPVIAFLWFLVIAILLSMLSEVLRIGNIFMIAMATMVTIRICAYYNEDLSRDIAKLIPFALLAVFLLEISKISLSVPFLILAQIPLIANTLVYYFIFAVFLEIFLRLATHEKVRRPAALQRG